MTPKTFDRAGFVYLLRAENGAFKIGRSKDPDARAKNLDVSPLRLTLVHRIATNDAVWLERVLHRRYDPKRIRGEWFALSQTEVMELKSRDRVERPSHLRRTAPRLRKERRRRYCVRMTVFDLERGGAREGCLWGDVKDAPYGFLLQSFWQRRERIKAAVENLRVDMERVNHLRAGPEFRPIALTFNFQECGAADDMPGDVILEEIKHHSAELKRGLDYWFRFMDRIRAWPKEDRLLIAEGLLQIEQTITGWKNYLEEACAASDGHEEA